VVLAGGLQPSLGAIKMDGTEMPYLDMGEFCGMLLIK